jgi:hypothetical protein
LIVLVVSPVLLWFGANAFLNVGLEPIINAKPDKLRIHWTLAWMWMPGDVSVWGLEIRGQGKNDQWLITNDHATATVDIHGLTERTFRASNVKGSGATFRYRFWATEPVDPTLDDTRPIVGLTNPPNPIPPPGKAKKGPWKIDLQGMEVNDVRELWVESYRYAGSAHVVGDLTLGNEISLAGHLTMPTGKMFRGAEHEMVDSLTGEMGGSMSGIIRGQPITRDVLMNLDATAHVKAQTDDLSFVNYYLQSAPWLKLDGRAELAIDIDIVDGAWALGSVITAHTTDLAVDLFDYEIRRRRHRPVGSRERDAKRPETHMGVSYGEFTIKREVPTRGSGGDAAARRRALVAGNGFELTAVSPDTQIGKPLKNMNVLIKIPESTIPDVKRFDRYLPTGTGLSIVGGSGRLAGFFQVSTSDGQLAGGLDLTGRRHRAEVRQPAHHVRSLAARADQRGSGAYDFSGTAVAIDHLGMRDLDPDAVGEGPRRPGLVGREITVTDGKIDAGKPTFLRARISMQCANSEPFVAVIAQKKNLPRWLSDGLYIENVKGNRAPAGRQRHHRPRPARRLGRNGAQREDAVLPQGHGEHGGDVRAVQQALGRCRHRSRRHQHPPVRREGLVRGQECRQGGREGRQGGEESIEEGRAGQEEGREEEQRLTTLAHAEGAAPPTCPSSAASPHRPGGPESDTFIAGVGIAIFAFGSSYAIARTVACHTSQ